MGAAASKQPKDGAAKMTKEATGKARAYAEDGKARVGGVLDELSKMMGDAAGTVDEKVGAQYGNYARNAAEAVSGFSESLKSKSKGNVHRGVDLLNNLVRTEAAGVKCF